MSSEHDTAISFVIPCYRSEQTVAAVIDEIRSVVGKMDGYTYEIIAVDDNSPDHVYQVLRELASQDPQIKAIRFAKNFGQHAGLLAGIRASSGEYVVTVDDDGQCPLDHLKEMIEPLVEGWDVSIAQYGKKKQSWFKNLCSRANETAANMLIDKPKEIQMGNYMALRRFVADEVCNYSGPYPYLSGLFFRSSAHVINVPMEERPRMAGGTTYTLRKLFSLWMNSFTAFSIKPLRFVTYFGSFVAAVGVIYGIIVLLRKIINPNTIVGWSSIAVLVSVLGGITLFGLGIVGEYIGRIYMSLNSMPQYVVRDSTNMDAQTESRVRDIKSHYPYSDDTCMMR